MFLWNTLVRHHIVLIWFNCAVFAVGYEPWLPLLNKHHEYFYITYIIYIYVCINYTWDSGSVNSQWFWDEEISSCNLKKIVGILKSPIIAINLVSISIDCDYPVILGELRSQGWCIFLINEELFGTPESSKTQGRWSSLGVHFPMLWVCFYRSDDFGSMTSEKYIPTWFGMRTSNYWRILQCPLNTIILYQFWIYFKKNMS